MGSYLYADDESGYTVAAALLDAADRGVKVRHRGWTGWWDG